MRPELAAEDALRLQILLSEAPEAVRIDEGRMTVHALTARGEARVTLHPTARNDQYAARVRELLGGHALGSPGGYPVYLERWTRMGQTRDKNLAALLLLGEPEAVVAVAHAPGLTPELARRAWWALPTATIASTMLDNPLVAESELGRELAAFLLEHLPFEENVSEAARIVTRILAPGLLDRQRRRRLWESARRKPHYYLGFLVHWQHALPDDFPARTDFASVERALAGRSAATPVAAALLRCLSGQGQAFLNAARSALDRPGEQDVVYALLDAIGNFVDPVRALPAPASAAASGSALEARILAASQQGAFAEVLAASPGQAAELRSLAALAGVDARLAEPLLARSSAVGSLMRRRLDPIAAPIARHLSVLLGETDPGEAK